MKYIRTKDGIFSVEKNIYNQIFAVNSKGEWIEFEYIENKILNQADTIEEVCDEFVIVFEDGHIMTDLDYESFGKEWYKNNRIRMRNAQYYGAIWTTKGLIYVAKLNDKGELELI